jgi:ParB family chromosome partitioning protein
MKLPEGKSRLDLVREGLGAIGLKKRGRMVVSIDRLREDRRNERRTFRNMEGLIASIKAVGLVEPLTVTTEQGSADTYRIITGHRRFRAAKAAGLDQVEVLIREPDDELTRRVKSIISNVQREDVGPIEMAEALQSLMDEDQRIRSQDDLARLIGKDKTWVSGMLRILSLPSDMQQKVRSTQRSLSYDAMVHIARLDNAQHQVELVEQLLSGATRNEIRQRISTLKGKPTESVPKPKRVYHTEHKATVIVQSENTQLTQERVLAALHEAMKQAKDPHP